MSGEKTFAPTEKRRREAARQGDVLRSRELATAIAVLVGAAWLKFAGPWLYRRLAEAVRTGLTWDRGAIENFDPAGAMLKLAWAVTVGLGAAAFASDLAWPIALPLSRASALAATLSRPPALRSAAVGRASVPGWAESAGASALLLSSPSRALPCAAASCAAVA